VATQNRGGGALTCGTHDTVPGGVGQTRLNLIQMTLNEFTLFQINSNLFWSKHDLPKLEKIEIKYGFEGFEERNDFPYRNFLFMLDFE
jgi:hypothetical protein